MIPDNACTLRITAAAGTVLVNAREVSYLSSKLKLVEIEIKLMVNLLKLKWLINDFWVFIYLCNHMQKFSLNTVRIKFNVYRLKNEKGLLQGPFFFRNTLMRITPIASKIELIE